MVSGAAEPGYSIPGTLIGQGLEELDLEQLGFKVEGPEELDLLNPDSPALDLLHIMVFTLAVFPSAG